MPPASDFTPLWPRDPSFALSPIPALDQYFPCHYPAIYVLLHIASDGIETVIRVAHSEDIARAIDLQCLNPLIAGHGPTHAAVRFSPTNTAESALTSGIDTAFFRQRFQPVA